MTKWCKFAMTLLVWLWMYIQYRSCIYSINIIKFRYFLEYTKINKQLTTLCQTGKISKYSAYSVACILYCVVDFNLISVLATHIKPYKGQGDATSWLTMILLVYNYIKEKLKQWWSRNPSIATKRPQNHGTYTIRRRYITLEI